MSDEDWQRERRTVITNALSVGAATGAYGISFGAISVTGGLTLLQTQVLSALMFTGGSQFALVGVLIGGGGAASAIATSVMLGARNAFYGLRLAPILQVSGWRRAAAAQLTIDESTAMTIARDERQFAGRGARLAFWLTGISVFVFWNASTLVGAVSASAIGDPRALGLDAAIPAGFLALVWPRLKDRRSWSIALGAGLVALVLTPFLSPGIPVLATALVAVVAGVLQVRRTAGEAAT
ncbi:MAG TPA: AzlC family ABC transporter permease [Candidatus Nanopelagicales bacterium]